MLRRVIPGTHSLAHLPPLVPAMVVLTIGMVASLALWLSGVDVALQGWLWTNYNQSFNSGMRVLGELGKGTAQVGMIVVAGGVWSVWSYVRSRKVAPGAWACWLAVPVFLLAGVLNWLMKFAIGRPRPKEFLMNGGDPWAMAPFHMKATFWSFPSGHACSTWAIAVWLMLVFPRARVPLFGVAVVLSASRFLAITPHYLGDVVAGGAMGAAVAMVCFEMAKKRGWV